MGTLNYIYISEKQGSKIAHSRLVLEFKMNYVESAGHTQDEYPSQPTPNTHVSTTTIEGKHRKGGSIHGKDCTKLTVWALMRTAIHFLSIMKPPKLPPASNRSDAQLQQD